MGLLDKFIRDRVFEGRYGAEKRADDLLVSGGVVDIAKTVPGSGECDDLNSGSTVRCNFQTHGAGNHTVIFSVEQKDGNLGMPDGFFCSAAAQGEATENSGSQIGKGAAEGGRIMQIPGDLLDDGNGSGIGGIRNDAGHIIGKVQPGSHQHRCGSHGKSGQDDGVVRTEAFIKIPDPAKTVFSLFDTEGDGLSGTEALGSLVGNEYIIAKLSGEGMSAAAVPEGVAPVSVEQKLDRGVIPEMVVASEEHGSVKGFDPDFLAGIAAHDPSDPADIPGNGIVLLAL